MGMDGAPLLLAGFHEAGHAVVAAALGLDVGDMHVNADDHSGGTLTGSARELPFIDQVAIIFAGLEAQNIWQCRSELEHKGGGSDYERFCTLVKDLPDDWRDRLRQLGYERANRLLRENKDAVEFIAQQLIERGHLTAAEFKRLIGS